MRVLVTGGAGFIGTHLVKRLAADGAEGCVFDNLHPQVHGPDAPAPKLPAGFTFVHGDVTDAGGVLGALNESQPEVVFHLAAETGTGQSMDEPARYCDVNVMGTAHLIEAMRRSGAPVRRVVLPSSRAVYGEGAYLAEDGSVVAPPPRDPAALSRGQFLPTAPGMGALSPVPTMETLSPTPCSIYASTKLMQEHLLLPAALTAPWRVSALRFQNVYGPGQSLRNPYTGVLSVFAQILKDGGRLNIFEDGEITRDFVYVGDAVEALVRAAAVDGPSFMVNIGSGESTTILHAARRLAIALGRDPDGMSISGDFRAGDVRHAVADIRRAKEVFGWTPRWTFAAGIAEFARWAG